ncbi:MAG TPA: sodium/proton-translocating pyrophosphatase, partial [Candidatus Limnocylindria bacterium]
MELINWVIPVAGIAAILFALYLARDVMSRDTGTPEMVAVGDTIREGADAFVKRQYTTIAVLAIVGAVIIGVVIGLVETPDVADVPSLAGLPIGVMTGIAFLVGAACSMASGIIGMFVSVRSNVRTAAAARTSLVGAVQVAMRGGAVSGFLVVALSLLGVWGIFTIYESFGDVTVAEAPFLIVGFGFGASFVALFAQLGGGIYTKAADVGSDLVGKVEAGIPEDDPRNAGVIADLVGDNVGDCAGRGADLFESTAAENIGAMILGVAVFAIAESAGWPNPEAWIFFPLVIRAFGLLATILAMFFIRGSETENPMNILNRGYWVTTILSVAGLAFVTFVMMDTNGTIANGLPVWVWFFFAGIVGLATSIAFVYITQYYTAGTFRPVREIAEASRTGPATNIISGTAVGYETTLVTAISIAIALLASYWLGSQANLLNAEGQNVGGIFGTAVATMGMLMTTAYILAMDTFGPITDNAGGVAEFSHAEKGAREITDRLDAVGNTTKALTKGYAIASASLAAFLLFSAYIDKINVIEGRRLLAGVPGAQLLDSVNLQNVNVFIAAMLAA